MKPEASHTLHGAVIFPGSWFDVTASCLSHDFQLVEEAEEAAEEEEEEDERV